MTGRDQHQMTGGDPDPMTPEEDEAQTMEHQADRRSVEEGM